jgi:hypothetical protein
MLGVVSSFWHASLLQTGEKTLDTISVLTRRSPWLQILLISSRGRRASVKH